MKYNRNLLRFYGTPGVRSIRYENYPISDSVSYYGFERNNPSLPLLLHNSGRDTWHCRGYSERTDSTILSLEYVQQGTFIFTQDGEKYDVHPGEMFIVYPGKDSSICCEPVTAVKRMIILRGEMLELICAQLGLDKINKFVPENRKVIDDLYDRIDAAGKCGTSEGYYKACSLCYNLLLEISSRGGGNSYPLEFQKVLDFINGNLFRNVSLHELSRISGVSNTALNLMFHKYLNCSPVDFFLGRKLELAKSLLQSRNSSVKEIAAMLDYPSQQYFATKFKEKFGVTPTACRKETQNR